MSARWGRGRPGKPEDVAQREAVHGRALAWGRTEQANAVIATATGLVIAGEPDQVLPWHLIDHAAWEPPDLAGRSRDAQGVAGSARITLAEHGELPPVIRQRVTRSVVASRRVLLVGDAGAVLAARRDHAGTISWTVVFDAGLDPRDPHLQQAARDALAEFRRSLGV